jgi:hypothetical protein
LACGWAPRGVPSEAGGAKKLCAAAERAALQHVLEAAAAVRTDAPANPRLAQGLTSRGADAVFHRGGSECMAYRGQTTRLVDEKEQVALRREEIVVEREAAPRDPDRDPEA